MTRSGEGVVIEIRPAPTPDERAALLRALAVAGLLDDGAEPSGWWAEGLREALDDPAPARTDRELR
jgi:hypothetical protein